MRVQASEGAVQARIEAALYAAGRPLSAEELARAASLTSKRKAVAAARFLSFAFNKSLRALEIVELTDQRFVMQLKPDYNPVAKRFASRPLLPLSVLKTLSHVIYFQPISAQDLARRRGPSAYRHVKDLEAVGFVAAEPTGRTRVYHTTAAFSEYFGLSSDPDVMRQQLASARLPQTKAGKVPRGQQATKT